MATSIVNAKVDSYIKQQADEVLVLFGKTPSDVIKALWEYIAQKRELPDFINKQDESDKQRAHEQKLKILMGAVSKSTLPSKEINRDYKELLAEELVRRYA
jgi:addiction module RelB/DinJ family antitoxin